MGMEERARVVAWAVAGCLLIVPLPSVMIAPSVSGEMGIAVWALFIAGLVLLGMALVGALRLLRGWRALALTASVMAVFVALLIASTLHRADGRELTVLGFASIVASAYVLIALWQEVLEGMERGPLTRSAHLDAALVTLVMSCIVVNSIRAAQSPWPSNSHSLALILAFAVVSAVLSLTAIYVRPQVFQGRWPWLTPVAAAVLLGFVMPFLGLLVTVMSGGFSSAPI